MDCLVLLVIGLILLYLFDEPNRRSGVYFRPTGSHNTDPFTRDSDERLQQTD